MFVCAIVVTPFIFIVDRFIDDVNIIYASSWIPYLNYSKLLLYNDLEGIIWNLYFIRSKGLKLKNNTICRL